MPRFSSSATAASDVGRAEPDALQVLVGRREARHVVGLDQLQVEVAAGALQQQALGQDAEAHAVGQRREAEDLAVELDPVRGAVGADVLDDAEEAHAGDRRRMLVDGGDRAEVDVVDRELVVAVDEVDQAVADAVDRGDVELHRPRADGHLPGAEVERAVVRVVGVADAHGEGADHRPLVGLHGAGDVGGLRVDDDVHRTLPVELDLARAVARDRPEPHRLQHAAQRLRPGRREFDELDAVESERVQGFGDGLPSHFVRHRHSSK